MLNVIMLNVVAPKLRAKSAERKDRKRCEKGKKERIEGKLTGNWSDSKTD